MQVNYVTHPLRFELAYQTSTFLHVLYQPHHQHSNLSQLHKILFINNLAINNKETAKMASRIPTSTSVTESAVIEAKFSDVWHLIKLENFSHFWSALKGSEFVKGASSDTDIVKWTFKDGTVLEVKQEEHSVCPLFLFHACHRFLLSCTWPSYLISFENTIWRMGWYLLIGISECRPLTIISLTRLSLPNLN